MTNIEQTKWLEMIWANVRRDPRKFLGWQPLCVEDDSADRGSNSRGFPDHRRTMGQKRRNLAGVRTVKVRRSVIFSHEIIVDHIF